jgi:hypothetical protein
MGLNGTCLTCPFKCGSCSLNNATSKASYLICTVCLPGYSLSVDAVCRATCNGLLAQSLASNGTCITCNDVNCEMCQSPSNCLRCGSLYTLTNGQCQLSCPSGQTAVFATSASFQCITNITGCITFL